MRNRIRYALIAALFMAGCTTSNHSSPPIAAVTPAQTEPIITSFTASPTDIAPGEATSLVGTFSGGLGVVTPGDIPMESGVPVQVVVNETTTFVLTVTAQSGAQSLAQIR